MAHNTDTGASVVLEKAHTIQQKLENAQLHIVGSQKLFDSRAATLDGNDRLPLSFGNGTGLIDPATVGLDVTAQLAFFRKLKFQYLEQKAKDQYIKIIVSDDAPSITAADNEELRSLSESKKQTLKRKKTKLAEIQDNIRTLAPLVEQDYIKAQNSTNESVELARRILDARLRLTRFKQAYPHPRLTIASATAQLDAQDDDMKNLSDDLQMVHEKIEIFKEDVKGEARQLERLRVDRADVDKLVRQSKNEIEDGRIMGLCDWFSASLRLHKMIHSLEALASPSENELRLSYAIVSSSGHTRHTVLIKLLFVPNTRQLADAEISGLPSNSDMSDVIGARIQSNDVAGLLAAVLARARAEVA